MADTKISGLSALTGAGVDPAADVLPIVDTSVTTTKKILVSQLAIALAGNLVLRSYLAGLTMSTAGSSATMSVAAGVCADSTNVSMMTLAAIGKTTSAWAVGTGNGGLDTGSIANSTWYHFYVIQRSDTLVVDVIFSTSASGPTLPTGYTYFRRIGSGKTNGSAQWTSFVQDGDYFTWLVALLDINTTNPGTAAVTATLTVPTGVNVFAYLNLEVTSTTNGTDVLVSDPAFTDVASASNAAPLASIRATANQAAVVGPVSIRTNTSAQVRYRADNSDSGTIVRIATMGWFDRRGRDS